MENTRTHDGLKYIGDGTQLGYVPTRNLTSEEVMKFGKSWLLASGLYEEFAPKPNRAARKAAESAKEQ